LRVSENSMREAFIRLRSGFLEICKERIEELERQMKVIQGDAGETEKAAALDTLRREAHTLAGSAGTYGYSAVSTCANALEEACNRGLDGHAEALSDAQRRELDERFQGLLSAADEMFANPEAGTVPF